MKKDNLKITAKEEEIMNHFWDKGALFVREVLDLYGEPKPHFNTLSTIVRGLEEKGLIAHKPYGNTYQYYALISKDKFQNRSLKDLIGKYYNNSAFSAISSLVKEEDISVDELKELISIIEKGR